MTRSKRSSARSAGSPRQAGLATLAIDVGGSGLKAAILDEDGVMLTERVRVATPEGVAPETMVDALAALVAPLPAFDRVSIGFPGVVRGDRVITAPHFGNEPWHDFPLAEALGRRLGDKPVRLLNDADVQGYGVIEGTGLELVLTLGTGMGSSLFCDGRRLPHMEFAQFPFHKKKTFNRYVGNAARHKVGNAKWNRRVEKCIEAFRTLLQFDRLYLGGGNASKLTLSLPPDVRIVANEAGLTGGIKLWQDAAP
ncbi:ROK family protein [Dyella sp.]|jgi:polyphosphate glucokinase|uniref:ROK family protein n=1 Tax=Dyella sp. TaxID=1869338 RepID=UPI002D76F46C|nr:ROK family protein [Dyella sp.]HET6433655.1 ROK family protein [Dyella sp.]